VLRSLAPLIALLAFVPAAGAANTYYAAPLTANTTTCDAATPCTLDAAVGKAVGGATVQLAPGDYHHAGGSGSYLSLPTGVTIQGQPGAQRPRILQEDPYTSCNCPILTSNGGTTTLRHLVLDQSVDPGGAGGLSMQVGDVVEDVLSIGGGKAGAVASLGTGTAQIRDSLFIAPSVGLYAAGSVHLEHATVAATGSAGDGIFAQLLSSGTIGVTVDNSIVQGGTSGHDAVVATSDPGAHIVLTAHYSAISRSTGDASGTGTEQIDFSDHDLAAEPKFNPGGFGVTGESPTVDAASAALTTVPTDFAGLPRILGPAPDMGAFEYAPAPAAQSSASDVTRTTATLSGSVTSAIPGDAHFEYGTDTTYGTVAGAASVPGSASPTAVGAALTGLSPGTTYHFRLVAANEHGTTTTSDATFTTAAATTSPPPPFTDTTPPHLTKLTLRWPRLRFVLDEPARVTIKIGKRSWSRRVAAGTVTITAPRKLRRALKRGRHKLRIVAVDAAGNRSTALTKRFRTR
jgi:hypothetical protein